MMRRSCSWCSARCSWAAVRSRSSSTCGVEKPMKLPAIPSSTRILLGVIVLAGTMIYGVSVGIRWEKGQQAIDDVRLQRVEDRAEKGAARAIAKNKPIYRYYTQEAQNEVASNPVYDQCLLPADGLRILNAIIEGRPVPA